MLIFKDNQRFSKVMDFGSALLLLLLSTLLLLRERVGALKLLEISVPPYLKRGESARLECRYEMESDELGSITWYKDNEHIYSFSQNHPWKKQVFTTEGVKIDPHRSNAQILQLQSVSLNSTGYYACEVNNDKAPFKAVRGEAYVEVLELPQDEPMITGEEKIYTTGDILALNCTSGFSHPPAQLQWFVNDIPVESDTENFHIASNGLQSSKSSLRFELNPVHLAEGKIVVKCVSTVQTSSLVKTPFVDTRTTKIYVQGHASLPTSSSILMSIVMLLLLLFIYK